MEDFIIHSGVGHDDDPPGRGSGRYAWGSGDNPMQHQFNFLSEVEKMKKKGIPESEIAKILIGQKGTRKDGQPMWPTTNELRAKVAIAKNEIKKHSIAEGQAMLEKCNGNMSEAARRLGYKNESSLRSLLNPLLADRRTRYENTADMIRKEVDKKGFVDISSDSNLYLGVSKNTMDIAVAMLEQEGYLKSWTKVPQLGTTHETNMIVLAKKGYTHADVQKNKFNVQPIYGEFTPDEGKTWWTPEFPTSVDSKRVYIRYAEDGGKEKDGVIELRQGVEDISLGNTMYSQVRIAVDGTNYMKGMAMYSDDIPKGYDIVYNTNKHRGTPAIDTNAKYVLNEDTGEYMWTGKEVLKRLKIDNRTMEVDRDNPFGALIKSPKDRDGIITAGGQRHYIDKDGNDKLSPINKLQDEGDWDGWSRKLSAQFLSKQPEKIINQQINLSTAQKRMELDEILNLTNPVIKKKLLEDFANNADSNASNLKVKGFKNQSYRVILPVPSLSDNEIYAPGLNDGEMVALVRYPHGGTFEIPILKNNTKHPIAKKILANSSDAVGVNTVVAEQLSGADFDGDFVAVIPLTSNRLSIVSTVNRPSIRKKFEGFDGKELYKLPDDAPIMKNLTKQNEMGRVSNLITDMTLQGANYDEIARAVKHSMVVIDAEKHHLDYKRSAKDFGIAELKKRYQSHINPETGNESVGAATIISRAKGEVDIPLRKEITDTSKMTQDELKRWDAGMKVYRNTGETKKKLISDESIMTPSELEAHRAGKKVYRDTNILKTTKAHRMDIVDDARDLVRDPKNKKEMAYANYANALKDMANEARREARSIKPINVSAEAQKTYSAEVKSLNEKLRIASMNNPRERRAQQIGNILLSEKRESNPDMDFEHLQRAKAVAMQQARAIVGAKKEKIVITDREWEAIQANAITTSKLSKILINTDQELFKQRATPRKNSNDSLTINQINMIKTMSSTGMYTQAEIAERLGISASTVSNIIRNS